MLAPRRNPRNNRVPNPPAPAPAPAPAPQPAAAAPAAPAPAAAAPAQPAVPQSSFGRWWEANKLFIKGAALTIGMILIIPLIWNADHLREGNPGTFKWFATDSFLVALAVSFYLGGSPRKVGIVMVTVLSVCLVMLFIGMTPQTVFEGAKALGVSAWQKTQADDATTPVSSKPADNNQNAELRKKFEDLRSEKGWDIVNEGSIPFGADEYGAMATVEGTTADIQKGQRVIYLSTADCKVAGDNPLEKNRVVACPVVRAGKLAASGTGTAGQLLFVVQQRPQS